jgi:hypothetical protein
MNGNFKKRLAILESKFAPTLPKTRVVIFKFGESIQDACRRVGVLRGQRIICVPEKRQASEDEKVLPENPT